MRNWGAVEGEKLFSVEVEDLWNIQVDLMVENYLSKDWRFIGNVVKMTKLVMENSFLKYYRFSIRSIIIKDCIIT